MYRFMSQPPHFLFVKPVGSLVYLLYSCLPKLFLAPVVSPSAGDTLMVHYEGGVKVEPGYFFGGVDDKV